MNTASVTTGIYVLNLPVKLQLLDKKVERLVSLFGLLT